MQVKDAKCVMLIDEALPLGLIANTAAVLGTTLGRQVPGTVGEDVRDGSGREHLGIVSIPIPILRATGEMLGRLRSVLYEERYRGLTVVDFSDTAQGCKNYREYSDKLAQTPGTDLSYCGLAIYGDKKTVNALTGSLGLLR